MDGADWEHPEGIDSNISLRMDHPVVHISWNDATAFCRFYGKRLPTEAEWEVAAQGGLKNPTYCWGNQSLPRGKAPTSYTFPANVWQGQFPNINTKEDGYYGTAPSRSFSHNPFGLFHMCGNVWEW